MQYLVTGNIQHDGKPYAEGDHIELSDAQAAQLIEAGVVESAETKVTAPTKPETKKPAKAKDKSAAASGPAVGGTKTETGEPSLDGNDKAARSEAKDVRPPVDDKAAEDVASEL